MLRLPVIVGSPQEAAESGTAVKNAGISGYHNSCDRDNSSNLLHVLKCSDPEITWPDGNVHPCIFLVQVYRE